MDTLIAVFITSLISFPQNSKKAPLKVRWWQKDLYFPKKAVFVKMFLWTSRIQFWQTRRKILDERRKSFDRCRRKLQKKKFFLLSLQESSYGHVKCNCTKPAEKFLSKCWKLIAQGLNNFKYFLIKKSFFNILILWTRRMQFSQPRRNFFNTSWKQIAKFTKKIKNCSFFQKKISLEVFFRTRRMEFSQICRQNFDQKPKLVR